MTKRVNYEDNIFFLDLILKQLINASKLNIDREIFYEKILRDTYFLNKTAKSIFSSLRMNTQLINRLDYLKNLQKFNRQFVQFLEDMISKELPLTNHLKDHFEEFKVIEENHLLELEEIKEIIIGSLASDEEADQIVSEEEFKSLLSNEESEN